MRRRDRRTTSTGIGAILAALAVLTGGCGAAPTARPTGSPPPRSMPSATPPRSTTPTPTPTPLPHDTTSRATPRQLTGLVRVVAVTAADGSGETSTGMVLDARGDVVTNRHGVAGARSVQVTVVATGSTYAARVVASDARHDVALLSLTGASGLHPVTFAAEDAEVGDPVTVVGDAHGSASRFVAASGTVVALDQTVQTQQRGTTPAERLTGLLLSTADVVTGDSGGATYDAHGDVVGMTTAAVATTDGPDGVSIPVGTLRAVITRLRQR